MHQNRALPTRALFNTLPTLPFIERWTASTTPRNNVKTKRGTFISSPVLKPSPDPATARHLITVGSRPRKRFVRMSVLLTEPRQSTLIRGVKPVPAERPYMPPNEMPPAPIHRVLVGQKALVTGASKGLGQAIAIGFAHAGTDVLVNYNSDETGARETAEAIRKCGAKAALFQADVAKEDEVAAMFAHMIDTFGRIDICVPNSGIQLNARIDEMTLAQWQQIGRASCRER